MTSQTPVRAFVRTLRHAMHESHPVARKAINTPTHKHDNYILLKKFGRTATTFFPFYAFVLGWPVSTLIHYLVNLEETYVLIRFCQFLVSSYFKRFGI